MHGRLALALALVVAVSVRPTPVASQNSAVHVQRYAPPLALGPVYALLQDRSGFLWMGTHGGLVRFDGFEAVEYHPVAGDSTTLRNGLVRALWEGTDGTLWVGTAAGLHRFDTRTGTATWLGPTDPTAYGSTDNHFIQALWVDPDQRVWSGALDWSDPARGGLHAFDPLDGSTRHYHHDPDDPTSLSHDWVRAIHRDARGGLWVGTWHGLNRLDPTTGGFERILHDPQDPGSLAYDDVSALLTDRAGRLWVGTIGGGLDLLDPETGNFRHHRHDPADAATLSSDYVMALAEDSEGRIWVATLDGLNRLDPSTGVVVRVPPPSGQARPSGSALVHITAGREGGLWIGGYLSPQTGFVDYADLAGGSRGALVDLTPDAADLPVTDLSAAAGELWVSTWGRGAMRIDPVTGERTPFPPSVAAQIPDSLWSVASDGSRVFLVTWDNDVVVVDLATQKVQRVGPLPAVPGERPARAYGGGLAVDGTTTWAAFNPGVLMGFTRGDTAVTFGLGVPRDVNDHVVDGEGWHWVATGTGIARFRAGEPPVDVWSLAGVSGLLVDAEGGAWVGTFEQGLFRLIPGVREPERFTGSGEGLPRSLSVSAVLEDGRGRIWVADNRRLWEIDPTSGVVTQHDPSSFVDRGGAIGVGVAARLGGTLYTGGTGGLLAIHPERLKANPYPPSVALAGLSVDNLRRALPEDGSALGLRHDENSLTFDYVGLHFTYPARNRYRVRLSGAESEWRDVGTTRSVTYPGLPGGTFAFEVMAANADGVWSEPTVLAQVRVLPPWWRTPWAYAGGLALMLSILWGIRRFELDRLQLRARAAMERSEAERLRSLDRMKSEFFEDMSHEFRTPLAIIQGQLGRLLEDSGDDERPQLRMAVRNARRMQDLTDRILDLARIESGSIELESEVGDLVPFLRALVAAFDSLAASRDIHLRFRFERDRVLLRFDADRLEMAITNLISNALKFTREGGAVAVTLRTVGAAGDEGGRIEIEVADTGIGIPARDLDRIFERFRRAEGSRSGEPGTGIGLALARSLVMLHGGTLRVSSQEGV
ncbi:MAG TPA: two-component regulator propeller domain-containing protein, partial [Longimicrobiales bacterium]|nr:two-component regulator propeller domain-containing protein [Longimicrobiales bacterium]